MSDTAPVRVLVVDDEESVRFFLVRGLQKAGYAVEEAADGASAIERISATPYDVVLTDIVMPGVSGLKVLSAVHEMDRDSVVILMTAHSTLENTIDALRQGAFDYLLKPFELKEVLVTIERGLERRAVERENRKLRFLVHRKLTEEPAPPEPGGIAAARRDWERAYISDLLARTRGNVTRAAELAGISRPNFHKKLRGLGINPRSFKG